MLAAHFINDSVIDIKIDKCGHRDACVAVCPVRALTTEKRT
jgi:ferredoxin